MLLASKTPPFFIRNSPGVLQKLSEAAVVPKLSSSAIRREYYFSVVSFGKSTGHSEFSSTTPRHKKFFSSAHLQKENYTLHNNNALEMFATAEIDDIEEVHSHALQNGARSYEDPETGFTVFTEKFHLERGTCCGNQCRHCPYGWENVSGEEEMRRPAKLKSGDKETARKLLDEIESKQHLPSGTKPKGQIKKKVGGTSGGRLTSKNVPYTRKGDSGTSQLLTGERRKKYDTAFEAMGTVDELCTVVGVAHSLLLESSQQEEHTSGKQINYGELSEWLLQIMSRLFDAGSHIAKPVKVKEDDSLSSEDEQTDKFKADGVGGGLDIQHAEALEDWIDTMTELLPECKSFLLPTGSVVSAQLHVCRTVCRRAERTVVPLVEAGVCDPNVASYLNRLSDFMFVASRWANYCKGAPEIEYRRPERRDKQRVATSKELRKGGGGDLKF